MGTVLMRNTERGIDRFSLRAKSTLRAARRGGACLWLLGATNRPSDRVLIPLIRGWNTQILANQTRVGLS